MAKKKLTVEQEYELLSQEEQILLRPDTMIGSVEEQTENQWSYNFETNKIEKQEVTYIPAYLKLFDEILTNASDHAQRGKGVKTIKVNIDKDWRITVWNDGEGIPIIKHKEHKMYIPEMVLGKLNSGSNYNDDEERYGAGRNGVGSGVVALFSKQFIINCADGKKSYYQELNNNATEKTEPIIKKSKKSYTEVSYITDHDRLPIGDNKEDTLKLCVKRIYDIAVYNPGIKIYFNDSLIKVNSMKDWMKLHAKDQEEVFIETINDKWEVGLMQSETDSFEHCSIVNGNTTWEGGTHVNIVMNNIVKNLSAELTKGKKGIKIRPSDIKNKFHLFLVSKVANPAFDTQTKVNLKTRIKDDVDLSKKTYTLLKKSKLMESILEWVLLREQAQIKNLNKKAAGKTIRVDKLVDAHNAGTKKSKLASLFIAEGDSAKGSAMNGLSIVGRDNYGIYPVRGRVLNVRDVAANKIINNNEIADIIKIIGLVPGKKYKDLSELRYGKVIFFTDADHFGISIKGLLLNFFHKMWPELLELGFCYEFISPIVKAKKGKVVKDYYDIDKYQKDKDSGKLDGFNIKYFKGLGTIQKSEMQEMFKNIKQHLIPFIFNPEIDNDKIDLLFNKKRANERKDWMLKYNPLEDTIPDKLGKQNTIEDFIDTEFITFSNYDNVISIPDVMDGLKPSQRKILYGAFKKNLTKEMKVAQFGAYIAEVSDYQHSEDNIFGTVIKMAQDFEFANNINLFLPNGNFGSRRDPDSAAAPRYIYTELNPVVKYIFRKEDECILDYIVSDGQTIEPTYYLPIIPMTLVNGTNGIGTGWSTDIPKYDPDSLIEVLLRKLKKPGLRYAINPHYKGWKGDYEFDSEKNTYITSGVFTKKKDIVHITELPVDISTDKYLSRLDKLLDDKKIKKIVDNSTNEKVDIKVYLNGPEKDVKKLLKLTNNISVNNMITWFNGNITKWETAEELLNTWFDVRLEYYNKRKIAWTKLLEEKYDRYLNLFKFIKAIVDGDLVINKKKLKDIVIELEDFGFTKIDDKYDYLLSIPAYSFTKEKYDYYKNLAKDHKDMLKDYKNMTVEELWTKELLKLREKL